MRKIVISGGPCSGKTLLIRTLNQRGYQTVKEAALDVIEEHSTQSDYLPEKDPVKFQQLVFEKQLELESQISADLIFLDRSLVDSYAYNKFYNIPSPEGILQKINEANYEKVFFLNLLPDEYRSKTLTGKPRKQPLGVAKQIHSLTEKLYTELGIPLVNVPYQDLEKRIEFILSEIK